MENCPTCSRKIPPLAKFCAYCGKPGVVVPPHVREPAAGPFTPSIADGAGTVAGIAAEVGLDVVMDTVIDLFD